MFARRGGVLRRDRPAEPAANLARRTHAPEPGARLRVRHARLQAGVVAAVDRRRRARRHGRQRDQRAGGLQLLAAARPRRHRLPRRRPDRPLRQHQLDGDRRLRDAEGPPAGRRRGAGNRRVVPRGRSCCCASRRRTFVERVDFVSSMGFGDGPGHRERLGLRGAGPQWSSPMSASCARTRSRAS